MKKINFNTIYFIFHDFVESLNEAIIKLSIQGRNKKKNVDLFKKAFVMQGCSIKQSAGDKQGYNMKSCKCIKKSIGSTFDITSSHCMISRSMWYACKMIANEVHLIILWVHPK